MPARQNHGFEFQNAIIEHFGLAPDGNYTAKWDAVHPDGTPVSIKVEQAGSAIELADFFRNAGIAEDFYMVVGFWHYSETGRKVLHEYYSVKVPAAEWQALFTHELDGEFRRLLKEISNDHADDAEWTRRVGELKRRWAELTPGIIRLNFKRDHKKQKRLQCSISNLDFRQHFLANYDAQDRFVPVTKES